jgi:hypothetical protein
MSTRRGSAERVDDFAVNGLRERLQRLRAHEAEAPELEDVTGHDGVVWRLADSDKVELAHRHVDYFISPPMWANNFLAASKTCKKISIVVFLHAST